MSAEDWRLFAYPHEARQIDAADLKGWLRKIYPDSKRGVTSVESLEQISGRLRFEPADTDGRRRYAILRGELRFRAAPYSFPSMGRNPDHIRRARRTSTTFSFTGIFEAVLTYTAEAPDAPSLRAVLEGTYPLRDRGRTYRLSLLDAIESRPR